jgi:UDP-GlcNAc3NAcA epimerase
MKIVSIIGTRPQYIKVKPIYDYCKSNNIDHYIIDTNQHYSDSVSKKIIDNLNIKIDLNLNARGSNEIEFIGDASKKIQDALLKMKNIYVLIYGDTNSSFAAALACYKNKIKFAHIEAGARCGDIGVPEEANRIYIDSIAHINYCTSELDSLNVERSIVSGDLEYELLKDLKSSGDYSKVGLMTIHRQNNTNSERIHRIFNFCKGLGPILLPLHHRLKTQEWFNSIDIPKNIKVIDPLNYEDIVNVMESCRFILTDSGGVLKTCPFFGKRTLILRDQVGWVETIEKGYARICKFTKSDITWLLKGDLDRDKNFYSSDSRASEIIIKKIIDNG